MNGPLDMSSTSRLLAREGDSCVEAIYRKCTAGGHHSNNISICKNVVNSYLYTLTNPSEDWPRKHIQVRQHLIYTYSLPYLIIYKDSYFYLILNRRDFLKLKWYHKFMFIKDNRILFKLLSNE